MHPHQLGYPRWWSYFFKKATTGSICFTRRVTIRFSYARSASVRLQPVVRQACQKVGLISFFCFMTTGRLMSARSPLMIRRRGLCCGFSSLRWRYRDQAVWRTRWSRRGGAPRRWWVPKPHHLGRLQTRWDKARRTWQSLLVKKSRRHHSGIAAPCTRTRTAEPDAQADRKSRIRVPSRQRDDATLKPISRQTRIPHLSTLLFGTRT